MGLVTLTRREPRAVLATSTRDWGMVGGLIVGLMGLTALPYLFGALIAGGDRQFMGIVLNVPDTAQYFSWARESARAVFIENKLTPEPGPAVFFNLFWWSVGRLSTFFVLDIAQTTQVVRPVAGALYVAAIFWLIGHLARTRREHWTAFLVATVGGGLGWLLVVIKQFSGSLSAPLDLYVTEPNAFLTVLAFPHQAMAAALQVVVLGLAGLAFQRHSGRHAALAGLAGVLLVVQHAYDLLIVYSVVGVLGLALALRDGGWWRTIGLGALVCVPSVPAAIYLVYITRESPIWRGVLAQYGNAGVYTPSPAHLVVLMGLPMIILLVSLPLAIIHRHRVGMWLLHVSPIELMIWVWLCVGVMLVYIPTDFQIKMLACWQVPVAFCATRLLLDRCGIRPSARLVAVLFVLLVLPVNGYLFAWRFVDIARADYPYFLTRDEVRALDWLRVNSDPSDVVLSSLMVGQYVPGTSGNTAFLAHWAQTLDFYAKRQTVEEFFNPGSEASSRSRVLERFHVAYVLYGPQERALGGYDPATSQQLVAVYTTPSVTVYRVRIT